MGYLLEESSYLYKNGVFLVKIHIDDNFNKISHILLKSV